MIQLRPLLILTISFILFGMNSNGQIKLPTGKKAIIVLTYDDGLDSHFNSAAPALDSFGLKGTFFMDGRVKFKDIPAWRAMSACGHELANHTIYHPCSNVHSWVKDIYATENYSFVKMRDEITLMNDLLFVIDSQRTRTFAFPCSEQNVNGKDYTQQLAGSGLVKYARTGGKQDYFITSTANLDPFAVPSKMMLDGTSASEMISLVDSAVSKKSLFIFMFHGIGSEYLTVSKDDHKELLSYIKSKSEVEVMTFKEAMDYLFNEE